MWTMCAAALDEYCGSVFWVSSTARAHAAEGRHSGAEGNGFTSDTFYPLKMKNTEELLIPLMRTREFCVRHVD